MLKELDEISTSVENKPNEEEAESQEESENTASLFILALIRQFQYIYDNTKLSFIHRFVEISNSLIRKEEDGITIFHGGPLDHRFRSNNPWVYGLEVRDENQFTNYHIVCFNCRLDNLKNAKVIINLAPEHEKKLEISTPEVQELSTMLENDFDEPTVLIRPSLIGSLAYPLITAPTDSPDLTILKKNLTRLLNNLGLEFDIESIDWSPIFRQQAEFMAEYEHFMITESIVVHNEEIGDIYLYKIFSKEDKWFYYELLTCTPLTFPLSSDRLQKELQIRVDSGCDSGMIYNDKGCDCHNQLLDALKLIKKNNGIIIHCPTQDGRGYGFNTKMETEAHKRGIPVVFNVENPKPTGTLTVAKDLFGETYDIRDFQSIGIILAELGFQNITMITDNKNKVSQLLMGGKSVNPTLVVDRQPTFTVENGNCHTCLEHVEEKHQDQLYF